MRLGGVFSSYKGIRQDETAKILKDAFNFDFENADERPDHINFHMGTLREIRAFLRGDYVGEGSKGDCFSYAAICNYRHIDDMIDDYKEITRKCKGVFPPILLISMCEESDTIDTKVIYDGEEYDGSPWRDYGVLDKVL